MRNILFSFCFFMISNLNAQIQIDTTLYFDSSNAGTIKTITNKRILKIGVFASEQDSDWKKQDKVEILRKEKKAFNWLVKEVKAFGVQNLNIDYKNLYLDRDFKVDSLPQWKSYGVLEEGFNHSDIMKQVWSHIIDNNMITKEELLEYEGGYFVSIFMNTYSISVASPDYTYGKQNQFPEFTVINQRTINGLKTKPQTIVHEFLHLLGAWDFYGLKGRQSKDMSQKLSQEFPNSIMLTKEKPLSKLELDPLTAWRIGLNNNPEEWYLEMISESLKKSNYDFKTGKRIKNLSKY